MLLESLFSVGDLSCKFIEKDKYNRDVMHCKVDNIDIGSVMVQMGMATNYSRYSGDYYKQEEAQAKREKRGIWKKEEPIACTMEAKLCSDGKTYVSRTGADCEFAKCPANDNGYTRIISPKRNTYTAPAKTTPESSSTSPPVTKSCCKYCKKGKPCGDSCISRSYTCHKGPGCAC